MLARVRTPSSPVREIKSEREREGEKARERKRAREQEIKRVRDKEREIGREREKSEGERERDREEERCRIWLLNLKGMAGALAPFIYLNILAQEVNLFFSTLEEAK
jgi:RNA recognition motif-containing protein